MINIFNIILVLYKNVESSKKFYTAKNKKKRVGLKICHARRSQTLFL